MRDQPRTESQLEIMVDAALAGHDLAPFEPADTDAGGYEARCRKCGKTVWVGENGLIYSLLEGKCPSEQ